VNRWDEILAFTDDGEGFRVLDPGFLEVVVKNAFTVTISNTGAEDVYAEFRLCLY